MISRRLTSALGEQTYQPARLLRGLIPAALLETYELWQCADDSLRGYMRPAALAASSLRAELRVSLHRGASRGVGQPDHPHSPLRVAAIVRRVQLRDADADKPEGVAAAVSAATGELDATKPALTLLNLLLAPRGSALRRLASLMMRLDDLSHILAWSEAPPGAAPDAPHPDGAAVNVDLLELPRLHLTFRARRGGLGARGAAAAAPSPGAAAGAAAGGARLYCEQHEGLYLTRTAPPRLRSLLDGIPHYLLLQREGGGLYVLVSAAPSE